MKRVGLIILLFLPSELWAGEVYVYTEITDATITGAYEGNRMGEFMADAGDMNGDGYGDTFLNSRSGYGGSDGYVLFGGPDLPANTDLREVPHYVMTIEDSEVGVDGDGIGDFNGDGFDDVILGDGAASPLHLEEGGALIVYGASILPASISYKNPSSPHVAIRGHRAVGGLGQVLSGAGDINGDGYTDVILRSQGAFFTDRINHVYIIYGGKDVPAELSTADLGEHGVRIESEWDDGLGWCMDGVGDVNGDGFDDILIGTRDSYGVLSSAYLIYGATDLPPVFQIADLGNRGVKFGPETEYEAFGSVLGAVGDVNGDGLADLGITAFAADVAGVVNAGEAFVIFGRKDFPSQVTKEEIHKYGITLQGIRENGWLFEHVSGPGKINGDEYDDPMFYTDNIVINLQTLFGSADLSPGRIDPYTAYDRLEIDASMGSALYLGDVNGDGFQDFAVSSPQGIHNGRSNAGRVRIVYGGPKKFPELFVTPTPTDTPTVTPTPTETSTPTITPTPTQTPDADLNGDGSVDFLDLFIFEKQWQKTSEDEQ